MKVVIFNLDGVLVDIDSSWQMIHRAFGTDNEENFQRYLRGEINYKKFIKSEIKQWGRVNIERIKSVLDKAPIMATAPNVINELKKVGYKTAIISSGISILADRLKKTLDIDYTYANRLSFDYGGWLTGEGEEVVDLLGKDVVLKRLAEKEGVSTRHCAVIGDSQFDISMFREAGFSVAFNAKDEAVKKAADLVIKDKDLGKILPWLTSSNVMRAISSLECNNVEEAKAIANSASPDNLRAPRGLLVRTWNDGKTVNVRVVCIGRVETMLATLDDLFACVQAAERSIKVAKAHSG